MSENCDFVSGLEKMRNRLHKGRLGEIDFFFFFFFFGEKEKGVSELSFERKIEVN